MASTVADMITETEVEISRLESEKKRDREAIMRASLRLSVLQEVAERIEEESK